MTQDQIKKANEINNSIRTIENYNKWVNARDNIFSTVNNKRVYQSQMFEVFKTEIEEMIPKKLESLKKGLDEL